MERCLTLSPAELAAQRPPGADEGGDVHFAVANATGDYCLVFRR